MRPTFLIALMTIVLYLFTPIAFGQDYNIDYGNDGDDKIKLELPYKLPEKSSLKFNFNYQNSLPPPPDYWNDYLREPKVYYVSKYEGLNSVVYEQIRRFAMKYYNQYFDTFQNNQDNPLIFADRFYKVYVSHNDQDRWWERSFSELLPTEKGGSRTEIRTIGNEHEIVCVKNIRFNNVGKFNFDDVSMDIQTESKTTKDIKLEELDKKNFDDITKRRPSVGIKFFKDLLKNDYFEVSGNIRFNLRVDQLNMENKSGVTVMARLLTYCQHRPLVDFQLKANARPFANEYSLELSAQLLTF